MKNKLRVGLPFLLKCKHLDVQGFDSWCSVRVCMRICAQGPFLDNRSIKACMAQSKQNLAAGIHNNELKVDAQNLKCHQQKPHSLLHKNT